MSCLQKCWLLHQIPPKKTNRCSTWHSPSLCFHRTTYRRLMELKVLHNLSWNKTNTKTTTWLATSSLQMSTKTTLLMAVRRNKSLCQFCTLQQSLCRSGASTQTYTLSSTKNIKTLSKMYFKYRQQRITLLEVKRNKETSLNHQQGTIARVYRINHNLNSHSPR